MVDLSLVKPQDLWYVVGLIATDGNLSIDGRHLSITSKDEDLLEGVKRALHINNKIGKKARSSGKEKKYSVLQISDVKFYHFLQKVGLEKRKSLTLKPLNIPSEYFTDFIRGVIDGDGNISMWKHKTNNNIQWSLRIFSGSQKFMIWLKSKMENLFRVQGKLYKYQKLNFNYLYTIKFGKFAAKIILNKCYYTDCLALARKNSKAISCLKSVDGLSKYGNVVLT